MVQKKYFDPENLVPRGKRRFDLLRRSLLRHLSPTTEPQRIVAEKIVIAYWRVQLIRAWIDQVLANSVDISQKEKNNENSKKNKRGRTKSESNKRKKIHRSED